MTTRRDLVGFFVDHVFSNPYSCAGQELRENDQWKFRLISG